MSKQFTPADVASHKDASSGMYIIIDENVYDVTGLSPFLPPPGRLPNYPFPSSPSKPFRLNFLAQVNARRRLRRRTPGRGQDPEARRGQGCDEAVLEIS
jgi:hypothetical protein